MNQHFSITLIKQQGKLVARISKKALFKAFLDTIPEGKEVDLYLEAVSKNGTVPQKRKIHVMIRTLADHAGEQFDHMKLAVKQKAGLIINDNGQLVEKSFADCSKEELNQAIKAASNIGEAINCLVD